MPRIFRFGLKDHIGVRPHKKYIPSGSCSNSEPESNIESLWTGCE